MSVETHLTPDSGCGRSSRTIGRLAVDSEPISPSPSVDATKIASTPRSVSSSILRRSSSAFPCEVFRMSACPRSLASCSTSLMSCAKYGLEKSVMIIPSIFAEPLFRALAIRFG